MLRLEDFSKEILIAVIKRKWFFHKKEILEECVRIKCNYDFTKVSKRIEFLINENKRLGTSLEEKLKFIKNKKELKILFEKQEKILDRMGKKIEDI